MNKWCKRYVRDDVGREKRQRRRQPMQTNNKTLPRAQPPTTQE